MIATEKDKAIKVHAEQVGTMSFNDIGLKSTIRSIQYPKTNFDLHIKPESMFSYFNKWMTNRNIFIQNELDTILRFLEDSTNFVIKTQTKQIKIYSGKKIIARVSSELKNIADSVSASTYIYDLKKDWDGQGSQGYKKSTWERAINFLIQYAELVLNNTNKILATPKIFPGPAGSIDVQWKRNDYRLLINIPEKKSQLSTFYADNYKSEVMKGTFSPDEEKTGLLLLLNFKLYEN